MMERYPQLYRLGQRNHFFSAKAFWLWVANALYHSLVRPRVAHMLVGSSG